MVFARTKLVIEDNCFDEDPGDVSLKYVGPHALKLYKSVYEIMKNVFAVKDSDLQEADYNWGKTDKGDKFKTKWWVHKDQDLFSYWLIRVDLSGQGTDEAGNAQVSVKSVLRTEYPQDTVWQRSLFYEMLRTLWHRMFYARKRAEYQEGCRHTIMSFTGEVKKLFEELKEK